LTGIVSIYSLTVYFKRGSGEQRYVFNVFPHMSIALALSCVIRIHGMKSAVVSFLIL